MEDHAQTTSYARPPIVVILGHVDHGKSSLLEAIREDFTITKRESGGITQHIGAYEARYKERAITFLDTPGHEAFFAMRSRGANVADIAVLVVAAEEGVKPQTKEAIAQAKSAGIPLLVAINKIDKPDANPERVKTELSQADALVEGYGGTVPVVLTSAKTKQGISELLDMILLMADVEELTMNPALQGEGVVVESSVDSGRGVLATLLLTNGTLKQGEYIATRSSWGRIKLLEDFQGNAIQNAFASMPVIVAGFEKCPVVGEEWKAFVNEEDAKAFLAAPKEEHRQAEAVSTEAVSTEVASAEAMSKQDMPVLSLILKADVAGSLEALTQVLTSLPQDAVRLAILDAGLGDVNESDVRLAKSTKAQIMAFRVKVQPGICEFAKREGVVLESFDVIYDLIQRTRALLEHVGVSQTVRVDLGSLKVLGVFFAEGSRQVVGGSVLEGEARKGSRVEIFRRDEKIGEGRAVNLQKDKKDALSAGTGAECGMLYEGTEKIQEGDILKFFVEETRVI